MKKFRIFLIFESKSILYPLEYVYPILVSIKKILGTSIKHLLFCLDGEDTKLTNELVTRVQ